LALSAVVVGHIQRIVAVAVAEGMRHTGRVYPTVAWVVAAEAEGQRNHFEGRSVLVAQHTSEVEAEEDGGYTVVAVGVGEAAVERMRALALAAAAAGNTLFASPVAVAAAVVDKVRIFFDNPPPSCHAEHSLKHPKQSQSATDWLL
jgi:hypothetical protein